MEFLADEVVMIWKHWIISLALLSIASLALAQNDSPGPSVGNLDRAAYVVPAAARLTERGQELAERLRQLRRIEATMGAKHPSRSEVSEEMTAVMEQLNAWSPTLRLPMGEPSLPEALPAMNEHDLRQLILRLSVKVERLESRVAALEKR